MSPQPKRNRKQSRPLFDGDDAQGRILGEITRCRDLPAACRIAIYNAATKALRAMVADLCDAPCLSPQLATTNQVVANDYNPNRVAISEMDLLEQSIRCDGLTMPVVVCRDDTQSQRVVVDGFHRRTVVAERLGWSYVPCSEIDRPIGDRMAATIRHNRARGKHQIDLMAAIVRTLAELQWDDEQIAAHLGMSPEELLRLKQVAGAARLLAASEYHRSWGTVDPADSLEGTDDDGEDPLGI